MFVKHAVDSAFSEETSVMSLHGELRNIIFDDSPLPVIQRNLVLASRPWSIYTTSSGKCVALHFSETKFYIWILKETHVWGGAYTWIDRVYFDATLVKVLNSE